MKAKAANEVGIQFRHIKVPLESTAEEIVEIVRKLNEDEQVSGILVQLPLGDHIQPADVRLVTEAVSPEKDVDG
jgi:methylenetetrahydrofolate dehydrogenase (NADP+)/methenyltetrahydrofolate cyclohydrolase/formyltetrahydrofolate synthetase